MPIVTLALTFGGRPLAEDCTGRCMCAEGISKLIECRLLFLSSQNTVIITVFDQLQLLSLALICSVRGNFLF